LKTPSEQIIIHYILIALCDEKCFSIFKSIAINKNKGAIDSANILSQIKLNSRDYHERLSHLINAGLITPKRRIIEKDEKEEKDYYAITELGNEVYRARRLIEDAIKIEWKLKALDAVLETFNQTGQKAEIEKVIDSLIDNYEIKDILKRRSSR
jgi:predicted transcriptional regulator